MDATLPNLHRAKRVRLLGGIVAVFVLLGAAWTLYWFLALRHKESTDDAYVAGNLVPISSRISGNIIDIHADNTQGVVAGQVLVRLDPSDADLALAKARSNLAEAARQARSLAIEARRLESLVGQRQKEYERAQGDLARRDHYTTSRSVSQEELSHARDEVGITFAALRVAKEQLSSTRALLQDSPIEEQPAVLLRAHQLREAWLVRQRCEIKSPVDGYVARRSAQVGAHVTPGTPLMSVVPLRDVWIDANFKEVQIAGLRIGQPVRVEADAYGSKVRYSGKVAGLAAGTGSVFSLLPPENATGNWIKVVQRLPVKITFTDEKLLREYPLRVGLSCEVSVDTSDKSGPSLLTWSPASPVYSTGAFEYDTAAIDREIVAVIAEHSVFSEPGAAHGGEKAAKTPHSGEEPAL